MKYRLQYGLLDDANRVIRWLDWPPTSSEYVIRRAPLRPAPTIETHGLALW